MYSSNSCVYVVSTDEGVYVDSNGKPTKDIQLQWGEVPSSIGMLICKLKEFSIICSKYSTAKNYPYV